MSDEPAASPATGDAPAEATPAPPPAPNIPEGPDADELRAIETLYETGDFREVNRRAAALAERTKEDPIRTRARELASRVQLDPFVLWAWGATVVVVAGIVYAYVLR